MGSRRTHLWRLACLVLAAAFTATTADASSTAGRAGVVGTTGRAVIGQADQAAGRTTNRGPDQAPDRAPDGTVTLITGDRVRLVAGDDKRLSLLPGKGRRKVTFRTHRSGRRLWVVPSDVAKLVANGSLDPRLFDVTGLIEARYDDARASTLPLIVSYDRPGAATMRGRAGASAVRAFGAIRSEGVKVSKSRVADFVAALPRAGGRFSGGVRRIWLDGKRRTNLDQSVPQIGAPAAWQAGYTGKGVTVAVLDSGVDGTHPDLAGRVAMARNFTASPAADVDGHGTHVASTIAGTAAASGGKYRGVAPDASILDGKVCEDAGFCNESDILAGMQWAAAEQHADVINLSLGGADTPQLDPLEQAVNTLTAQTGSLFVIAAGNTGPQARSVESPGSADAALTVGAVDRQDHLADFSSRGPRLGDGAVKPDVTAPGVDIVAAKAELAIRGEPVDEHYTRMSGTSMATPHVAGAAALLVQQRPDWTPTDVKAALMASAAWQPSQTAFQQGAGRVHLPTAVKQSVLAEPSSLSFGTTRWPHHDDTPVTRRLTYRNLGGASVTLSLATSLTGPDGKPAPAGALGLSTTTITVPAGGTASVTVTSDTRHEGPDGDYTGRVVAIAGDTVVGTPVGVDREEESYDLTIAHFDPAGQPTPHGFSSLYGWHWGARFPELLGDADGVVTVRLPKGRYYLNGQVELARGKDGRDLYHLVQPLVRLDRDQRIEIDPRRASPVKVRVPRSEARVVLGELGTDIAMGGDIAFGFGVTVFDDLAGVHTASLGEALPASQLTAYIASQWARPNADGSFTNTSYLYGLLNTRQGTYFNGFSRVVDDADLATVTTRMNRQIAGRQALKTLSGSAPGVLLAPPEFNLAEIAWDLPATVTQYLEAGPAQWRSEVREVVKDDQGFHASVTRLVSVPSEYGAGKAYAERWNAAVFGPVASAAEAGRVGNNLWASVPMYSDGDGHPGVSLTDTAATKLYRDGEQIAESTQDGYIEATDISSEPGRFRLTSTATRPTVSGLSTRTDADWTFNSQQASDEGELLPLWVVRYTPAVDAKNAMKRRPVTVLPLRFEAKPGAPVGTLRSVTLNVSGDDGAHWSSARLERVGANRYVAIFATPQGEHLSLKAKAADSRGNATEQTILRGYSLEA